MSDGSAGEEAELQAHSPAPAAGVHWAARRGTLGPRRRLLRPGFRGALPGGPCSRLLPCQVCRDPAGGILFLVPHSGCSVSASPFQGEPGAMGPPGREGSPGKDVSVGLLWGRLGPWRGRGERGNCALLRGQEKLPGRLGGWPEEAPEAESEHWSVLSHLLAPGGLPGIWRGLGSGYPALRSVPVAQTAAKKAFADFIASSFWCRRRPVGSGLTEVVCRVWPHRSWSRGISPGLFPELHLLQPREPITATITASPVAPGTAHLLPLTFDAGIRHYVSY